MSQTLSKMTISPEQCRGARAMLALDQAGLAELANVSRNTIASFEGGLRMPGANNLAAIRAALEAAGVEFIAENGGGAGVRLKKQK
jgi:transcriptional regulator with XRE-family HTH domain